MDTIGVPVKALKAPWATNPNCNGTNIDPAGGVCIEYVPGIFIDTHIPAPVPASATELPLPVGQVGSVDEVTKVCLVFGMDIEFSAFHRYWVPLGVMVRSGGCPIRGHANVYIR